MSQGQQNSNNSITLVWRCARHVQSGRYWGGEGGCDAGVFVRINSLIGFKTVIYTKY